jgi:hypothetical protein
LHGKQAQESSVLIDTTVQEKNLHQNCTFHWLYSVYKLLQLITSEVIYQPLTEMSPSKKFAILFRKWSLNINIGPYVKCIKHFFLSKCQLDWTWIVWMYMWAVQTQVSIQYSFTYM